MTESSESISGKLRRGWLATPYGLEEWNQTYSAAGFKSIAQLCRMYSASDTTETPSRTKRQLDAKAVQRLRSGIALEEKTLRKIFEAVRIQPIEGVHYKRASSFVDSSQVPKQIGEYVRRSDTEDELVARIKFRLSHPQSECGLLLSLEGDGGLGKTRLALEVMRRIAETYPVCFISFEHAEQSAQPEKRYQAFLETLGRGLFRHTGAVSEATIHEELGRGPSLLVLDNLETVSCELVDTCLFKAQKCAASLAVLATSRIPVGPRGSNVFDLSGGMPPAEAERLLQLRFSELLPQDAPARRLSQADRKRIVSLCEFIPLAIENVASMARTPFQPVKVIQELTALRNGTRSDGRILGHLKDPGLSGRNRAIDSSMRWSYHQIPEWAGSNAAALQRAYRLTGVFCGPFTIDDFEAIAGSGQSHWLADLQSIYLLSADPKAGVWTQHVFRQEFARTLLEDAGELEGARTRFIHHYLELLTREGPFLECESGNPHTVSLAEPNCILALHVLADRIESGDGVSTELFLKSVNGVRHAEYYFSWQIKEVLLRIEKAAAAQGNTRCQAGAAQILGAIELCKESNYQSAYRWFSKEFGLRQVNGEAHQLSEALRCMGECMRGMARYSEALDQLTRALKALPDSDRYGRAFVLRALGIAMHELGLPGSEKAILEAISIFSERGDSSNAASCELVLADVAAERREYEVALSHFQESCRLAESATLLRQRIHENYFCLRWFVKWPPEVRDRLFSVGGIRKRLEETLDLVKRYGNPEYARSATGLQAEILWLLGERDNALHIFEQLLTDAERRGDLPSALALKGRINELT